MKQIKLGVMFGLTLCGFIFCCGCAVVEKDPQDPVSSRFVAVISTASDINGASSIYPTGFYGATPYIFKIALSTKEYDYRLDSTDNSIVQTNRSTKERQCVAQPAGEFQVEGNNLYYLDYSVSSQGIRLCKKDIGSGTLTVLAENLALDCNTYLVEDWIYYVSDSTGLCRINLNTLDPDEITDSGNYWIHSRKIYLQSLADNSIRALDLDGSNDKVLALTDKSIFLALFEGDMMYFTDLWYPNDDVDSDGDGLLDPDEKRYIYRVSINGGKVIPWIEAYTHKWSIREGYLWFINEYPEVGKTGEFKVDLQTGEVIELS